MWMIENAFLFFSSVVLLILSEMSEPARPYSLLAGRQNAVGIQSVLLNMVSLSFFVHLVVVDSP